MKKKIESGTQTSILLPDTLIQAIKLHAIQRAYEEKKEVKWTDIVRETLIERFERKV